MSTLRLITIIAALLIASNAYAGRENNIMPVQFVGAKMVIEFDISNVWKSATLKVLPIMWGGMPLGKRHGRPKLPELPPRREITNDN